MANNITKNQHYVPRCVLKHFTTNGKTHINKFSFSDESLEGKNIEKVCALKYFYGKEQDIEKIYGLSEDDMAKILDEKLTKGDVNVTQEEMVHIKAFIGAQSTRTPNDTKLVNDVAKGTVDALLKLKEVENIPEYRVEMNDRRIKVENLKIGIIKTGSFCHMDLVLLKSSICSQFIIGQDPVIECNPFLWKREKINNKGLAYYGYTIIMPISSKYCMCLYDTNVYKKLGKNGIKKLNYFETKEINLFQVLNSDEYVLLNKVSKNYLKRLLNESNKKVKENKIISTIEKGQIHNSMNNSNRVPLAHCFKITKKTDSLNTKQLDCCIRPEVKDSEYFVETIINELIEQEKNTKGSI